MKGFFIVINKTRPARGTTVSFWKSEPAQTLPGWQPACGDTIEEAMSLQKKQYFAMRECGGRLPDLTASNDTPMATGKMTRFVEVE